MWVQHEYLMNPLGLACGSHLNMLWVLYEQYLWYANGLSHQYTKGF
jgi:hypothetical protein